MRLTPRWDDSTRKEGLLAVVALIAAVQVMAWPLLRDRAPGAVVVGVALALVAPSLAGWLAGVRAGRAAWWICGAPLLVFLAGGDWEVPTQLAGMAGPWLLGWLVGWAAFARRTETLPMPAPSLPSAPPRTAAPMPSPTGRRRATTVVALAMGVTAPIVALAWLGSGGGTSGADLVGVLLTWAMMVLPLLVVYAWVVVWRTRR